MSINIKVAENLNISYWWEFCYVSPAKDFDNKRETYTWMYGPRRRYSYLEQIRCIKRNGIISITGNTFPAHTRRMKGD